MVKKNSNLRIVKTLAGLRSMPEWKNLSEETRLWMSKAYKDQDFIKNHTDGISYISQLGFKKPPGHPIGCTHDWLEHTRSMSMKQSDLWFKHALREFGFPNYSKLYWVGLRSFGVPYRLFGRFFAWAKAKLSPPVS